MGECGVTDGLLSTNSYNLTIAIDETFFLAYIFFVKASILDTHIIDFEDCCTVKKWSSGVFKELQRNQCRFKDINKKTSLMF